jgi:UTP--glucose-1-phosphate uridylyltransferase
MNNKYYELYKKYKTDFSIKEVEPILNFTNYNTLDISMNEGGISINEGGISINEGGISMNEGGISMNKGGISMNEDIINKLAIVKLNGGLGTTMKCSKAKGCLEVFDNNTFLDIFINQVIFVNKKFSSNIPIVLMNSEYTEIDTQVILDKYKEQIDIYCFNQEFLYRFHEEDLDNDIVRLHNTRYPPGTGNFYESLYNSKVYGMLKERGIEYLFISNIDNLYATFDNKIYNYVYENKISFLMEVCKRTETDKKGGTPVLWNNKYHLLEIAQVSSNDYDDFTNISKFPYFNTNNFWIRLDEIKDDFDLYIISNKKTVNNEKLVQLESVIGSAYSVITNSKIIEINRNRFFPIKTLDDYDNIKKNYFIDKEYNLQKK